jgi:hypothetical protein
MVAHKKILNCFASLCRLQSRTGHCLSKSQSTLRPQCQPSQSKLYWMQHITRVHTLEPSMMLQFNIIPLGCGHTHHHGPRTAVGPHTWCPTHRPSYHLQHLPQQNPHEQRRQVGLQALAVWRSGPSTAGFG